MIQSKQSINECCEPVSVSTVVRSRLQKSPGSELKYFKHYLFNAVILFSKYHLLNFWIARRGDLKAGGEKMRPTLDYIVELICIEKFSLQTHSFSET